MTEQDPALEGAPDDLDVIGSAEAAEILRVPVSTITRRRLAKSMPPLVADTAATPVWWREDVERLAAGDTENYRGRRVRLVGLAEVAAMLNVDKSQVGRWRRAEVFPDPAAQVAAGPLWRRGTIGRFQPPTRGRKNDATPPTKPRSTKNRVG